MSESHRSNNEIETDPNHDREAIWAIRPRWSTLYFTLFTLQVVAGFGIATYDGLSSNTPEDWKSAYFDIMLRTGQIGIAAADITFTAIELLGSIMLVSEWIRVNLVEPAIERRRNEGRAQLIAEIKDWDRRRQAAEINGEPFDEPPPYVQDATSNNKN